MPAPSKAPSALDFIMSKAKAKPTKKDKDKPVLSDESLAQLLREYKKHKDAEESHKTLGKQVRDQICVPASEFLFSVAGQRKEPISTIAIHAGDMKIDYTLQNSYSDVDFTAKPRLEEHFGEDFQKYFLEKSAVVFKAGVLENENLMAELLEAIGANNFDRFFEAPTVVTVTDAFHLAYVTDEAFRQSVQPLIDDQTIKPRSPSLKVG